MQRQLFDKLNTADNNFNALTLLDAPLRLEIEMLTANAISGNEDALFEFHKLLAQLNGKRFAIEKMQSPQEEFRFDAVRTYMETRWIAAQKARVQYLLDEVPTQPEAFLDWFEVLEQRGFGQHHPLFDFLENHAERSDFKYFMMQELATEAGFDDLVAMTQVQAPHEVKLELACNYWDEMGNGQLEKMHSVQLSHVSEALQLTWDDHFGGIHWQALALSNVMIAFASHRSYFNQSIGALGAIELTAPGRAEKVTNGLKRLGFTNYEYRYYALHAVLDIKHWRGWKQNAVLPLISNAPERCAAIAEGALLRLLAGSQCFDIYSEKLNINNKLLVGTA